MIGQILATLLPVFLIAGSGAAYGRFRTPDIRSLNTDIALQTSKA